MKKIIKGKRYDTDTATTVGEWINEYYPSDFRYECETLYRKRNGEYFLHGMGGARSRYAKSAGDNTWSGGAKLMPLTYESARAWAEEHLTVTEYEREFGEVSEGDEDESVVLSVRITPTAKAMLDRLAAKTGASKGDLVSMAIMSLQ